METDKLENGTLLKNMWRANDKFHLFCREQADKEKVYLVSLTSRVIDTFKNNGNNTIEEITV